MGDKERLDYIILGFNGTRTQVWSFSAINVFVIQTIRLNLFKYDDFSGVENAFTEYDRSITQTDHIRLQVNSTSHSKVTPVPQMEEQKDNKY